MRFSRIARIRAWGVALGMALGAAGSVQAVEGLEFSGFGTIGFSKTNRDLTYQRFIDRNGTFDRDSRFGLQADWRLSSEWSVTYQGRIQPAVDSDNAWEARTAWAFAAWRPNDDWLLRVGRLRAPLFMHSEVLDVGQATPFARLPTGIYALAPTDDFDGFSVNRTLALGSGDLSVDGIVGKRSTFARLALSQGVPGLRPAGVAFNVLEPKLAGAALTWTGPRHTLRASLFRAETRSPSGSGLITVRYPFVQVAPGVGYYNVLPGPHIVGVESVRNTLLSFGGEWRPDAQWRISGEFVRNRQHDTDLAADLAGAYLAVARRTGRLTPYAYVAKLRTGSKQRNLFDQLTHPTLPSNSPVTALLNAAQRAAAEGAIFVIDQSSLALGASWAVNDRSSIKFEWSRSRIGKGSRMVDPVGGQNPSHLNIDVLTLTYSFTF